MKSEYLGLKGVGVLITAAAIVMSFLVISFIDSLGKATSESCTCGATSCNMVKYETPTIVYAAGAAAVVLFLVGVTLFVKGAAFYGEAGGKSVWVERLKKLERDEKEVYRMLMEASGTLFQSELIDKTGWSKVKVSRTLDKLESMRLLERRRRGLTNIIVLKD